MDVYTFGSMVPMGGGSSGLVKLRSGCVGRTQAVGMVRAFVAWTSSEAAAEVGAPGTGPTTGVCSTGRAEEPGRRGGACCGGGCCWRRGLVEISEASLKQKKLEQNSKKYYIFSLLNPNSNQLNDIGGGVSSIIIMEPDISAANLIYMSDHLMWFYTGS